MKKTILSLTTLVLSSLALTPAAHATHAYRSWSCRSATLQLRYTGNYPIGGLYAIAPLNADLNQHPELELQVENPLDEGLSTTQPQLPETALMIVSNDVLSKSDEHEEKGGVDCPDFDTQTWKTREEVSFGVFKPGVAEKLGIVEGQKIVFECENEFDTPNRDACTKEQ